MQNRLRQSTRRRILKHTCIKHNFSLIGSSASNPLLGQSSPKEEPLSDTELKEVFEYALNRLHRGDPPPASRECTLRVLRRVGYGPSAQAVYTALSQLPQYTVVPTILPVCQLNHPNTFLSLWALRHQ